MATPTLFDNAPDLWDAYETEGAPECAPSSGSTATTLRIVPKRSLRDHLEGVDLIIEAIEQLDAENITEERKLELSTDLISALAGTRQKVDNVNSVIGMYEGLEASAAAEIERLKKRTATFARQRTRLQDYVIATMEASKLPKLEGNTSTLALRKNPPSVRIEDETAVPRAYFRFPLPPPVVDKASIASDLKRGVEIAGVRLVQTQRLVRS
jgi:hypothetical protein